MAGNWLARTLLMVGAVGLAVACWAGLRLEVRANVPADAQIELARLIVDGHPQALRVASENAPHRLEILHVAGTGALVVEPLTTAHNGQFTIPPEGGQGQWRQGGREDGGGALTSDGVGSRLRWEGWTSEVTLTLRAAGGPCRAIATWDGTPRVVDVPAAAPVRLTLPSSHVLYANVSPWAREVRLAAPVLPSGVVVLFGSDVVARADRHPGDAALVARLGGAERARIAALALGRAGTFAARAAALIALWFVLGLALTAPILARLAAADRAWVPVAAGFSVFGVLVTSVSYVTSVRVATPVALLILLVGAGAHWRRAGQLRDAFRETISGARRGSVVLGASLVSTMFFFRPVLRDGSWYLGHACTDAFYYANYADRFLGARPLSIVPHIILSRISDIVSLGAAALVAGTDARSIFAPLAAAVWVTLAPASAALLRRLGATEGGARAGGVLVAFSAAVHQLFSLCYLAHYLFVFASLWATFFAVTCLSPPAPLGASERRSLLATTAAIIAFAVSIYAFQFALAVAWVIVAVLVRDAAERRDRVRTLVQVGLLSLLFANLNLSVIPNFFAMKRVDNFIALDNLGRWVVFPFHDSPLFAPIALGFRDFSRMSDRGAALLAEMLGGGAHGRSWIEPFLTAYQVMSWVMVAFAVVLAALGLVRCVGRRPERLLVLVTMALLVADAVVLRRGDHVYPFGKMVLTIGAAASVLIALGLDAIAARAARRTAARWLVAGGAAALVGTGLVAGFFEGADSWLPRRSALLHQLSTHLPVFDRELIELERFLREERARSGGALQVTTRGEISDWKLTDRDRVLAFAVEGLTRPGVAAVTGRAAQPYRIVWHGRGLEGCALTRLSTPLFDVCGPEPASGQPDQSAGH